MILSISTTGFGTNANALVPYPLPALVIFAPMIEPPEIIAVASAVVPKPTVISGGFDIEIVTIPVYPEPPLRTVIVEIVPALAPVVPTPTLRIPTTGSVPGVMMPSKLVDGLTFS